MHTHAETLTPVDVRWWTRGLVALCFAFVLSAAVRAGEVASFTLVNASTNNDIQQLNDGDTIDLATVGSSLNVRANISGTATKVNFALSGAMSHTQSEGVAPYALYGDSSGNYNSWTPVVGNYSLTANCDGAGAKTITFTVANDGGDDPPPPPPDGDDGDGTVTISGELKRWHKVTLTIDGPFASETGTPNPFLDYRMDVTFTNGSLTYKVPGYFAADGNAANSSATSGTKWRAHLSPDLTGTWTYTVSFTYGSNVAINGGGAAVSPYNGKTGTFSIAETDKTGRDLRAKGRLQYIGGHYLKFAGNGEYFLKQGADAPENFLAYADFDGPFKTDGQKDNLIKTWSAHVGDWKTGDPSWKSGKGKGIIGAVNYLASEGMNAFSFLPMNIGGDDRNVFPYLNYTERVRLDVSRLAQWQIVMEHGTRKGMFLHFKTQETENELLLDSGNLGTQRKLYYRELIARFAHNLALNWNLGEEINNATTSQKQAWAQYFFDNDPYHHHIVIHNGANHHDLLGSASKLTGFSLQTSQSDFSGVHSRVKDYLSRSVSAGKPWAVACDEPGDASHALRPDYDAGSSHEDGRKNALWGTFLAGGWGNEWYFGYKHDHSDLTCEDFRSRDNWWDYCRYALEFFPKANVPYWEMKNDNGKSSASSDYCFFKAGEAYIVYLKNGGTTNLDLTGVSGDFDVKWYDPRNGGSLKNGSVTQVSGGGSRGLGNAPNNTSKDWVILVKKSGTATNQAPSVNAGADQTIQLPTDSVNLDGTVSDDGLPEGAAVSTAWSKVSGPGTVTFGNAGSVDTMASFSAAGTYVLRLTADDTELSASDDVQVVVNEEQTSGEVVKAINCGGAAYTATDGTAYVADVNFNAGKTYTTSSAIAGTEDDTLYKSERWYNGNLKYTIPVTDGDYQVTLKFAEVYFDAEGKRVFDVKVEGQQVVDNLDLVKMVGKNAAYDVTVTATVADGNLNVELVQQTQNPKISAILVVSGSDSTTNEAPVVDAGADQTIQLPNSAALNGSASDDGLPNGTLTTQWSMVSGPGTVTFGDASALSTTASFSVAGSYVLRLTADDTELLSTDDVTITVEEEQADGQVVAAINCGGGEYTAGDGTLYSGDGNYNAGSKYSTTAAIAGTTDDKLYQSERYYNGNLQYAIPLPNGNYEVTLKFAEVYFDATGKRIFDVKVEGGMVVDNLDIVKAVGKNAAHDVKQVVTVADGELTIALVQQTQNPKISAILVKTSGSAPVNQAPSVDAGADQTIQLPNSASLNGTVSDDGLPGAGLSTSWSKVSGPGTVSFGNAGNVDTTASFSAAGTYVLRLTADDSELAASDDVQIVVDAEPVADLAVTGFTLVNASTDQDLRALGNGDTINLTADGTALSIRAAVSGTVGSVKFYVDGTAVQTENVAPYAIAGDTSGDYKPWTPPLGTHTIKAVPYSGSSAGGTAGPAMEITITVVE